MLNLTLETQITTETLYGLLAQLSAQEKLALANRLRAEVSAEQFTQLTDDLTDTAEITMDEIVAEVKAVRQKRYQQGKQK
jgi:tRNA A37 threonylcarbamoyladenosine synthetase subunit TsaC/SUA5/YrdC